MLLGIEGRIQTRQYESETGMKYITEVLCDSVQFLENKSSNTQSYEENQPTKSQSDEFYETSKKLAAEDDLPF